MASVVLYFFSNTNFQNTDKIMIKPNELRIGNYLFMPFTSENVKVTGLALKEEKTQVMYIQSKFGASQYFALPEQYSPIELTKEIVLNSNIKADFRTCYRGDFANVKIGGQRMYYFCDTNTFEFSDNDHVLKYLHEFQNLFFSLCGEDLVFSTEP